MGSKCLQFGAITCAVGACAIFIAVLASPSWITGCIKYENIFSFLKHSASISESAKQTIDFSSAMMKGSNFCIQQGILKFATEVGSFMHAEYLIPVYSLPIYQIFGAFGMIVAIGSLMAGAVLLIYASSRNTEDYTEKSNASNFSRKAMIALIVAGIFGLGGMVTYTAGSVDVVNDPITFFVQFGQTEMDTALGKMGVKFLNEMKTSSGRGKRDINSSDFDAASIPQIRAMLDGLKPGIGYAFVLGWLAVILVIISVVLAALARKHLLNLPYTGNYSVKL